MLAWHSQVHHLEELGALLTVTDSTAAPESTGEKPTVATSKVCELTPLGFHLGAPRWLTAHPMNACADGTGMALPFCRSELPLTAGDTCVAAHIPVEPRIGKMLVLGAVPSPHHKYPNRNPGLD
jgi:hypothetical protein